MKVQINSNQNNDEIDEQKIKNNFKEVKQNIFEEKEKPIEPSILKQGFLINRMDNLKNKREIDIQIIIKYLFKDNNSLEKEKLKKDEEFFISKGYILTEKSCERMVKLIHYIENKIPVLLEGPTGTSKTRTTLIACEYMKFKKNKQKEENDKEKTKKKDNINNLLRFNLSRETKIDDLLEKFIGDQNSPAGLKIEEGLFMKAYRKGYKLLLDEINLAKKEVLECIQQAIDNKILSFDCNGRGYVNISMHDNFSIIATQNPNKGEFARKRQDLGAGFLSRFEKIYFPNFEKSELIEITKKLVKSTFKDKIPLDDNLLEDIVSFHIDCRDNSENDIQCFTIREIEGVITSLSNGEDCYQTLMNIYASRYEREKKIHVQNYMKKYPTLRKLTPKKLDIPENFPNCYVNPILIETSNSVLFSLKNKRNVIIVGHEESGLTTIAR
jgi:midasin (ATPase involved in ribosome maturation)